MTYPDRETRTQRRWLLLVVVLFLVVYISFAVEAKARQQVCISAMTIEAGHEPVTFPEVCR